MQERRTINRVEFLANSVIVDKQTLANQRYEINEFCQKQNLSIDHWVQETISGTKSAGERKLGILLNNIHKDDLIICAELSRLGRNMFMVMDILHTCMAKECRVWTVKEGYRLGDDIQSKVLAFAFGMAADIERQLISTRTREALARKKAEGQHLGRQCGSRNKNYKLDNKADLIKKRLDKGVSKKNIATECGVARTTLIRWMKGRNDLI